MIRLYDWLFEWHEDNVPSYKNKVHENRKMNKSYLKCRSEHYANRPKAIEVYSKNYIGNQIVWGVCPLIFRSPVDLLLQSGFAKISLLRAGWSRNWWEYIILYRFNQYNDNKTIFCKKKITFNFTKTLFQEGTTINYTLAQYKILSSQVNARIEKYFGIVFEIANSW